MSFGSNSKKVNIFRDDIKDLLNDYMSFRHFIRHSYSSELEWDDMKELVENINELWDKVKFDFELFLNN